MAQLINVKDWAIAITKELSTISSLETKEEVQVLLQQVANELESFLKEFQNLQKDLVGAQMHKSIVKKFRRQINSETTEQDLYENFEQSKEEIQDKILYTNLLNFMVSGYYLLNKIRDILMEPITYAIAFQDDSGKMVYVDNLELEQLLEGVASLSSRIRLTENNFARLEIDIKDMISNLNTKKLEEDSLYTEIQSYTATKRHTYIDRHGKRRTSAFSGGHLWETYRYMKLYKIPFSEDALHAVYEQVRRGNLIYTKGGDVLSEQDKYGTSFALSSMATINIQLKELILALRKSSLEDVSDALQGIFIQKVSGEVDVTLQNYINKDIDKLTTLLKLN